MSLTTVLADAPPMGTVYGPQAPQVWTLKKSFSFCQDERFYGSDITGSGNGGSVPSGMDVQSSGCIQPYWATSWDGKTTSNDPTRRTSPYLFTGEQIGFLVVARDPNGALDLTDGYVDVGESKVAKCNEISDCKVIHHLEDEGWMGWSGTQVKDELDQLPRAITVGNTIIDQGYNPNYDKVYECILTVTPDMSGPSALSVEVVDQDALSAMTQTETFNMNPAVILDITTTDGSDLSFPAGVAGSTVYSDNELLISNDPQSLVDIAVWLGGTDLTSPDHFAKCPITNVLDVQENMQFRCELNQGLFLEQEWQSVNKVDLTSETGCFIPAGTPSSTCYDVNPLFVSGPDPTGNILLPGYEAKCDFRLYYPVPCVGMFTGGNLVVLMRAI